MLLRSFGSLCFLPREKGIWHVWDKGGYDLPSFEDGLIEYLSGRHRVEHLFSIFLIVTVPSLFFNLLSSAQTVSAPRLIASSVGVRRLPYM